MQFISSLIQHFIQIFALSAPWLLLGFFIAGIIKVLIPPELLQKHLGDDSPRAVIKGALFGAPIPLCSCGVIPAALGLRRAGASKASTTAFLIATPETGVDSISITYALLGPFIAIIRPIAAVCTAITAGLGVLFFTPKENPIDKATDTPKTQVKSCCASKKATEKMAKKLTKKTNTCCSKKQAPAVESGLINQITQYPMIKSMLSGLQFTFISLMKDIVVWLLLGLAMAALIMTIVPADFLAKWGSSPYAYLMMAIIGVPMYVCATSSTPIAAGLLFAGVSPGAILVFLLVGPATNVATLAIIAKELGKRILGIYLTTIVFMGFLFGYLTDYLAAHCSLFSLTHMTHQHEHLGNPITVICAIVLLLLILNALGQKYVFKK